MTPLATLIDAIAFAAERHLGQTRKDARKIPYIYHPVALLRILAVEAGVDDPVVLMAAALHDTIEDTATTAQELRERFGDEVARVVQEVTDDKSLPKQRRKDLQVEHAAQLSQQARLVKLADKIANLRDMAASPPADWPIERVRGYYDWAAQVVDGMRPAHARLEALFDEACAARDATG